MCSFHVICTVAFECPSSVYNVRPLVGRLRPLKFLYVCSAAPIVCAQFAVAENVFFGFFCLNLPKNNCVEDLVIIIYNRPCYYYICYYNTKCSLLFCGARKVILSKTC